jgi:hypothetical protein
MEKGGEEEEGERCDSGTVRSLFKSSDCADIHVDGLSLLLLLYPLAVDTQTW